MERVQKLQILLLKEKLERLTNKKVILKEAINTNIDIDELERRYKTLTPKLKEIVPANIREWSMFKQQLQRYVDLFKLSKTDINKVTELVGDVEINGKYKFVDIDNDKLSKYLLNGQPAKHSLWEVLVTLENSSSLRRFIIDYFLHGDLDISTISQMETYIKNRMNDSVKATNLDTKRQERAAEKQKELNKLKKAGAVVLTAANFKQVLAMPSIKVLIFEAYWHLPEWAAKVPREQLQQILDKSGKILEGTYTLSYPQAYSTTFPGLLEKGFVYNNKTVKLTNEVEKYKQQFKNCSFILKGEDYTIPQILKLTKLGTIKLDTKELQNVLAGPYASNYSSEGKKNAAAILKLQAKPPAGLIFY